MGWKEIPLNQVSDLLIKDLPASVIKDLFEDTTLLINSDTPPVVVQVSREVLKTFRDLKSKGVQPLFLGARVCDINEGRTELSINFASKASVYNVLKVFINSKAEQLFLYTRDIWSGSIIKVDGRVLKGKLTFVYNENGTFLGLAFPITSDFLNKADKMVLKHLVDIGEYLRCEK